MLAALIVARPYWPCEGVREEETGLGLAWVWTVLICLTIAVVGRIVSGAERFRVSKADFAVLTLIALVGLSVSRAFSKRPAINLAWEWVGVGVAYFLIRNLPRSRRENQALAAVFLATAVAVSTHGLYYNRVVFPSVQEQYRRDPDAFLARMNIARGSAEESRLRDRLLYSNEVFATFALANSLAGFLVGPAVLGFALGLESLRNRRGGSVVAAEDAPEPSAAVSAIAIASALLPYSAIVAALLLTKSRSAYVGFAVGAIVLGIRRRKAIGAKRLTILAGVLLAAIAGSIAWAASLKRFDWLMVVDSTKSLRYRLEYWRGAWRVIVRLSGVFWRGLGPGQFGSFYLLYRLPESSEEIQDPHNLILEAWAVAGAGAAIALIAAIAFALRDAFGGSKARAFESEADDKPGRTGWVIASGAAGWVLAAAIAPKDYGPFAGGELSLVLWLILAVGWGLAIGLGAPLWRRISLSSIGPAAAGLAVAIHLLAAGGIGFSAVSLGLWGMLALAQNARVDRLCGRATVGRGRLPAFLAGIVAAAMVGTFVGTVFPFWNAERALEDGHLALNQAQAPRETQPARLAAVDRARLGFEEATRRDLYFSRPWIELARVEYLAWTLRGSPSPPQDPVWNAISIDLREAASMKYRRAPFSLEIPQLRIAYANALLQAAGSGIPREYASLIRGQIRDSARLLVDFDPTNALFRARCALASAEIGRLGEAVFQAEKALELDALTPHRDRKLDAGSRKLLNSLLPEWKASLARRKQRPESS